MTEITLEFTQEVSIDTLKELKKRGFEIYLVEPHAKELYECNLDDLKDLDPELRLKAIYNGAKQATMMIKGLLNDCNALLYMHTLYKK